MDNSYFEYDQKKNDRKICIKSVPVVSTWIYLMPTNEQLTLRFACNNNMPCTSGVTFSADKKFRWLTVEKLEKNPTALYDRSFDPNQDAHVFLINCEQKDHINQSGASYLKAFHTVSSVDGREIHKNARRELSDSRTFAAYDVTSADPPNDDEIQVDSDHLKSRKKSAALNRMFYVVTKVSMDQRAAKTKTGSYDRFWNDRRMISHRKHTRRFGNLGWFEFAAPRSESDCDEDADVDDFENFNSKEPSIEKKPIFLQEFVTKKICRKKRLRQAPEIGKDFEKEEQSKLHYFFCDAETSQIEKRKDENKIKKIKTKNPFHNLKNRHFALNSYAVRSNENFDEKNLKMIFGSKIAILPCHPRRFRLDVGQQLDQSLACNTNILATLTFSEISTEKDSPKKIRVSTNAAFLNSKENLCLPHLGDLKDASLCQISHEATTILRIITECNALQLHKESDWLNAADFVPQKSFSYRTLLSNNSLCFTQASAMRHFIHTHNQKFSEKNYENDAISKKSDENLEIVRIFECCVCYRVTDDGFVLATCQKNHFCCTACWTDHAYNSINNQSIPIKCPAYQCDFAVDFDLLTSFLPWPVMKLHVKQTLHVLTAPIDSRWRVCQAWGHCCVFHMSHASNVPSACPCGHFWCQRCPQGYHWPLTCRQNDLYRGALAENGDFDIDRFKFEKKRPKIEEVSVKPCPFCGNKIEKVVGCDHISCVCGRSFCYRCLKSLENSAQNAVDLHNWETCFDTNAVEFQTAKLSYSRNHLFKKQFLYDRAVFHRSMTFNLIAVERFKKIWKKAKNPLRSEAHQIVQDMAKILRQCHHTLEYVYAFLGIECKKLQADCFAYLENYCGKLAFRCLCMENVHADTLDELLNKAIKINSNCLDLQSYVSKILQCR